MLAALFPETPFVTLAIFDLDNTLLGGDSDNLWNQFVCERGLVDGADFAARNDQFYEDYKSGALDIDAYLRFALSSLVGHPPDLSLPLSHSVTLPSLPPPLPSLPTFPPSPSIPPPLLTLPSRPCLP